MKLITKLRESHRREISPAHHAHILPDTTTVAVPYAYDLSREVASEMDLLNDDEHLGIGAMMPQDVAGLNFLDSYRRRIPDLHEEFPPHGLTCVDDSAELEY